MKGKLICLIILFILVHNHGYSCDGCGCSLGMSNPGLLSLYRSHYIGFGYSLSSFKSVDEGTANHKDYFHQGEMMIRIQLDQRWSFSSQLPYRYNLRQSGLETNAVSGLGDTKIKANFLVLKPQQGNNIQFAMEQSFGFRLPTGKYNSHLHDYDLPDNFNLGLGSFGLLFQNNTAISKGKKGMLFNTSIMSNLKGGNGYKFGNQFGFEYLVYNQLQSGNVSLTPALGISVDQYWDNRYANGNKVPETGGHGFFGVFSFNLKIRNLLVNLGGAVPVSSQYSDQKVNALSKFHTNFIYTFNQ